MITTIVNDKREILQLACDIAQVDIASVGRNGVTKIVAYEEPGQMAMIPYLAIYKGNFLVERIPAYQVRIIYKEKV